MLRHNEEMAGRPADIGKPSPDLISLDTRPSTLFIRFSQNPNQPKPIEIHYVSNSIRKKLNTKTMKKRIVTAFSVLGFAAALATPAYSEDLNAFAGKWTTQKTN